jgi:hypothetical protein
VLREENFMGNITPQSVGSSDFIVRRPPSPPTGVLDVAACGSQQIEGTSAGAPTISSENSPASKRRKNR